MISRMNALEKRTRKSRGNTDYACANMKAKNKEEMYTRIEMMGVEQFNSESLERNLDKVAIEEYQNNHKNGNDSE